MLIKELLNNKNKTNEKVLVNGWVKSVRISKKIAFIALGDGSCIQQLQLVVTNDIDAYNTCKELTTGTSIRATGTITSSPATGQKYELHLLHLEVVGKCPNDYPLQKKGHTLEFLRDIIHLRPRSNTFGAIFRIRSSLAQAVHRFFAKKGFFWAHTPIITASDAEGAGEQFTVTALDLNNNQNINFADDFFKTRAKLTVSGQLEAEFLVMGISKVYTFGPTFRAEHSNTTRHLAEFWMIEPEVAFANANDNMNLAGEFLRFIFRESIEHCYDDIVFLSKFYKKTSITNLEQLINSQVTHLSYSDAITELQKSKQRFEHQPKWGSDLQTEHERYLAEVACKGLVIVYDYPKDIKSFYMRSNDDGKTVAAMDLLVPGVGELIGGSQREERYDVLRQRMLEMNLPEESLRWYLDLRRYGSVPHAGFGLGFERLIMFVTGMSNIRDVITCPRVPGYIGP